MASILNWGRGGGGGGGGVKLHARGDPVLPQSIAYLSISSSLCPI